MKEEKNHQGNKLLYLAKGDVVKFYFDHCGETVVGKVINIEERLGLQNMGLTKYNPLVTYKVIETDAKEESLEFRKGKGVVGTIDSCDQGYAIEVLQRTHSKIIDAPYTPNLIALNEVSITKSIMSGCSIESLIRSVIQFYFGDETLFFSDMEKAIYLYRKQKYPGLIYGLKLDRVVSVRKKVFIHWVKQNRNKFLIKKKVLSRILTEEISAWEEDLEWAVENKWEEDQNFETGIVKESL